MARPKLLKTVCELPKNQNFYSGNNLSKIIKLSVEEYETIRLMDNEFLSQSECAELMGVSRPTVQILYADARKKIAEFLVDGGSLVIDGGNYSLCQETACKRGQGKGRCKRNCNKMR